jgi:hypothetical protein
MHPVFVCDGEADDEHARERSEVRPRKPAPTSARVPCGSREEDACRDKHHVFDAEAALRNHDEDDRADGDAGQPRRRGT